jgi:hypothetical protein
MKKNQVLSFVLLSIGITCFAQGINLSDRAVVIGAMSPITQGIVLLKDDSK